MGKNLFISEKPSVAAEFAKALKINGGRKNGYIENEKYIVTWCVGHLVTMSYPEIYDQKYKKWNMEDLPFIPDSFKYEIVKSVKQQFDIVASLLNREDVEKIYVCTDSGREGEYIYRLVEQEAGVKDKLRYRVWIDSQTEEEILRGIKEAKPESEYDNLAASAFLRAKEDYLMGINFSRVLTLKYGFSVSNILNSFDKDRENQKNKPAVISVGRVMTCVLGMVVRREREIKSFVKTSFYKVSAKAYPAGLESFFNAEWKVCETSAYANSPKLYKENGFKKKEDAEALINRLSGAAVVKEISKKKEIKNPPLLYNLAELQNDCSKLFKIDPDTTLRIVQELYEKKLTTYPRTDARVLSTAVAKEIYKNISGVKNYPPLSDFAQSILDSGSYKNIAKTKYVNDKLITDHYAIIPTGQGLQNLARMNQVNQEVYKLIVRRFLSIFFPAAEYRKISIILETKEKEQFTSSIKVLIKEGYLTVAAPSQNQTKNDDTGETTEQNTSYDSKILDSLKKGSEVYLKDIAVKEGETSPPKRYTSGSIILAMENAGQLIEDEELRAQIKGSGIGTSATRAEILKKLFNINYLKLNSKTQVITPTLLGELINDVTYASIRQLLNPELTASWEKGLTYVAEGSVSEEEYMQKLRDFVGGRTLNVKKALNSYQMEQYLRSIKR
ncbi:MAG: DNA topoisomerase [Eubacteriales bacterium]|nr:DNA topoisomerase [Eubacteriales bacterium]